MKTTFSQLAVLETERSAGTAADDSTGTDKQPTAGAFDAVLAAVASQAATLAAANKPAPVAPSTLQTALAGAAASAAAKDLTRTGANTTASTAGWPTAAPTGPLTPLASGSDDALPGVPFAQLVAGQGAQAAKLPQLASSQTATTAPLAPEVAAEVLPTTQPLVAPQTTAQAASSLAEAQAQVWTTPAGAGQSGSPATANGKLKSAQPQDNRAGVQAQGETLVEQPVVPLPSVQSAPAVPTEARRDDTRTPQAAVQEATPQADARLLAQPGASLASPVQGARTVMNAESTTASKSSAGATGRARAAAPVVAAPLDDVAAPGFVQAFPATSDSRAAMQTAVASTQQPVQRESVEQPSLAAAQTVVAERGPQAVAPVPARGAQPLSSPANVQVEFVELAPAELAPVEGSDEQVSSELTPRDIAGELESSGEPAERESSDSEPRPDAQQQSFSQGRAVETFQSSEVQGVRGLEQVVASLLRASADPASDVSSQRTQAAQTTQLAESAPGSVQRSGPARGQDLRAQPVITQKSSGELSTQQLGEEKQVLIEAAQRREEELSARRELVEQEPVHAAQHVELKPSFEAPVQEPAPLLAQTPGVVLPDPDAALMGKLSRGEGINAANISIDHPELGALDLTVQNENGRVDVRATAETPKAAAVLRAHESALRYGIQQAGMTFGALRVRSRGGEGEGALKTREVVKQRRRNHEWEA